MAPVETDAATRSNSLPIAIFGGQMVLVAGLTVYVLLTTRRAAKAQPPSMRTRAQNPARRRYAIIFSILALLSLASVTTFAVLWRAISYVQWAEHKHDKIPGSIWNGRYGTGETERWRMGDWITDIDLLQQSDAIAIHKPEGFIYTSQYAVGLLASSIFMGVEGVRRNLSTATTASFVLLASMGSLGYALSLFFVTILYTPISEHSDENSREDILFTPYPIVYDVAIAASTIALNLFPELVATYGDARVTRLGYLAMPLFFAFAPQMVPMSFGRKHGSKQAAHNSYAHAFYVLSMASFLLHWRLFASTVYSNTPSERAHVWDIFTNSVGKGDSSKSNRLLQGFSRTGQKLKSISTHPAISVTSLDVLFTSISLLTWTFTRNLDVDAILESSVLSFIAPKQDKRDAIVDRLDKTKEYISDAVSSDATTSKKRVRPSKKSTAINGTSVPSSHAAPGRSTRGKNQSVDSDSRGGDYESDMRATYQPTEETKRAVAETEADGAMTGPNVASAGESTALALFLAFSGGLGQLAASSLGAEVTGP